MINLQQINDFLERKEYTLIGQVGSGGTSKIYLVKSKKFHQNFILKQVELKKMTQCKQCELEALQSLSSVFVIRLYDFEIQPDYLYLILEHCQLGSLEDIVKKRGPFHGTQLLGIFKEILTALNYVHSKKVAHSDIKPGNILIDKYGRARLADFGFSKRFLDSDISTQRAGSLQYIPPEILCNTQFDPFMADVWSTGITFYFLAVGNLPWPNLHIEMLNAIKNGIIIFPDNINPSIKMLIQKMVQLNPKDRSTVQNLLDLNIFDSIDVKDGYILPDNDSGHQLSKNFSTSSIRNSGKLVMRKSCSKVPAFHTTKLASKGRTKSALFNASDAK